MQNPSLTWREKTIHITVPNDQSFEAECSFEAKNTTSNILKIIKIVTSCGCTVAKPSTFEVKPGESLKLFISVKLGPGQFTPKSIIVESDDPSEPIQTLQLVFDIASLVCLSPSSLELDNRLKDGKMLITVTPQSSKIQLIGVDSTDFTILPVMLPNDSEGKYHVEVVNKNIKTDVRAKIILYFIGENKRRWEQTVPVTISSKY
jgi:hypothetical protein